MTAPGNIGGGHCLGEETMHFRAIDHLVTVIIVISGCALVFLVAITGWQVYGRYILNDTPTWAERLALLLILVVALPLSAIGLREDTHLGISFVVDRLPTRWQRLIEFTNTLLLGAFGAAMAVFSMELVLGTWNRNIPLLGVPQALQYVPLVVTGLLVLIFMSERMWFLFHQQNKDQKVSE